MDPAAYEHLTAVEAVASQNELRQRIQIRELTTPSRGYRIPGPTGQAHFLVNKNG